MTERAARLVDDPRVAVARLDAGEPAPAAGVWLSDWTAQELFAVCDEALRVAGN